MQEEVLLRVCRCATLAWKLDQSQINKDSSMDTIPQWDSMGHLKLLMTLEKEFGLTFQMQDAVRMRSIEKICQIINETNVQA